MLSGGQAPGGHNVISGIFDYLQDHVKGSTLYGFRGGPAGIMKGKYVELTADFIYPYRNQVQHVEDIVKDLLTKIQDGQEVGKDDINALKARKLIVAQTWKGYSEKKGPNYAPKIKKTTTDLTREHIQSFWNFDTLFQPQQHTARDSHDTFFLRGLVGRNGTGKTTFLRHMAMHAIDGIPPHCQILHVEQEVVGDETIALQCVLNADIERAQLLEEEADLLEQQRELEFLTENGKGENRPIDKDANAQRLEEIYKKPELIDAYSAEARATTILATASD